MTEKGIRVYADASTVQSGLSFEVYPEQQGGLCYSKYNLITDQQLAERDKAIARAAFEAGRKWDTQKFNLYDLQTHEGYSHDSADDYLQSEQFKKLVGA